MPTGRCCPVAWRTNTWSVRLLPPATPSIAILRVWRGPPVVTGSRTHSHGGETRAQLLTTSSSPADQKAYPSGVHQPPTAPVVVHPEKARSFSQLFGSATAPAGKLLGPVLRGGTLQLTLNAPLQFVQAARTGLAILAGSASER